MAGLRKISVGQPLDTRASTWNAFVDAAEYVKAARTLDSGRPGAPLLPGMVYLQNDSGADRDRHNILGLSEPIITSDDNLDEFQRRLTFKGVLSIDGVPPTQMAVLVDPIDDGDIGRAMVRGVTQVPLYRHRVFHEYAVYSADNPAYLESAAMGDARILWSNPVEDNLDWALVEFPIDHGQLVQVTNSSGETIRDGYACEIASADAFSLWQFSVQKPSADNLPHVLIYQGPDLADGESRWMRLAEIMYACLDLDGAQTITIGDTAGTQAGSWELLNGNLGFLMLGSHDVVDASRVFVRYYETGYEWVPSASPSPSPSPTSPSPSPSPPSPSPSASPPPSPSPSPSPASPSPSPASPSPSPSPGSPSPSPASPSPSPASPSPSPSPASPSPSPGSPSPSPASPSPSPSPASPSPSPGSPSPSPPASPSPSPSPPASPSPSPSPSPSSCPCTVCDEGPCTVCDQGPCSSCDEAACTNCDQGACTGCDEGTCEYNDGPCTSCDEGACTVCDQGMCASCDQGPCWLCDEGPCTGFDGACTSCDDGMCMVCDQGGCMFCDEGACTYCDESACSTCDEPL